MVQVSEVTVTWTPITSGRVQSVQIQSRIKGVETDPEAGWTEQAASFNPAAGNFKFTANAPGTTIEVRMRSRMEDGVYSPWVFNDITSEEVANVYIQPNAPTNPQEGFFWVDTSAVPLVTKVWTGTAWMISSTIGASPSTLISSATINAILDSTFSDPAYWGGLTVGTNGSGPNLLGVERVARQVGDGSTETFGDAVVTSTIPIAVRGGERLQVGVSVHTGVVSTGRAYAQVRIKLSNGTETYEVLNNAANTLNTVTNLSKNIVLPANAVSIQLQLVTSYAANVTQTGTVNFGKPYAINLTMIGGNLITGDGTTVTEGMVITSQGTALYLTGQGALATLNTVPPSKLTYGSTDNLIADVEFTDVGATGYWQLSGGAAVVTGGTELTTLGLRRGITLATPNNTTSQGAVLSASMTTANRVTVEPGARYNIAGRAYYPVGFTGVVRLQVIFRDSAAGTLTTITITGTSFTAGAATSAAIEAISQIVTAPALAATVEFRWQVQWGTTLSSAGLVTAGYPQIQRVVSMGTNQITDTAGNPLTDGMALNQWVTQPKIFEGFDAALTIPTGWYANNQATLSVVANSTIGSNVLRITATNTDPNLIWDGPNLLGSTIPRVRARARPIQAVPAGFPAFDGLLIWRTAGHDFGSTYALRTKGAPILNQWDYYEWDLSSTPDWMNSTITGVRFDFAASQQNWEVDWIQFLANVPAGSYVGSTLASVIEAQTTASSATIAKIVDDNMMTRYEKPDVIQEYAIVQSDYSKFTALATNSGVSTTAITTSYNALTSYLTGLSPPYTDLTTDTVINGSTLRSRFADFWAQEADLLRLTGLANGNTALWAGVTGSGKPADNATVGAPSGTYVNGVLSQDITGRTQYFTTTGRFISGLGFSTGQMFGSRAPVSAVPTASDRGSNLGAVISIPAHTRYYPGGSVNYNAGSINVSYSTTYYVYCDDPNTAGGSVTYVATTNPLITNASMYRYYVAQITTPASGGSSTDGSSGGGGSSTCVAADSFMPLGGRARDVQPGDLVIVLDYATMGSSTLRSVQRNRIAVADCVRLTSATGITLVASKTTPITLRDGSMLLITEALGKELPVQDASGFRWEQIVSVEEAGSREVAHISAFDSVYAAGERADAYIFTHNIGPAKP